MARAKKKTNLPSVYLDSCVFIHYLNNECLTKSDSSEESKEMHRKALRLLRLGETRKIEIVTSTFTFAEVVAKSESISEEDQERRIEALFGKEFITPINYERKVAEVSRMFTRRISKMKPPDSIHIATAIRHKADCFITFDNNFIEKTKTFIEKLGKDLPHIKNIEIADFPQKIDVGQGLFSIMDFPLS